MTPKEIKKEIKKLRRLKLSCKAGSKERLSLHHKIKELQGQLSNANAMNKEKEPLIQDLYRLDPLLKKLEINLNKFSVKELQKHIELIKKRRR